MGAWGMEASFLSPISQKKLGFPGGSDGKESACIVGDLGLIPGLGKSPGGGHPFQYSCSENPHGQRSLMGHSPWGHKESNMTERLSTAHVVNAMKVILEFLSSVTIFPGAIGHCITII